MHYFYKNTIAAAASLLLLAACITPYQNHEGPKRPDSEVGMVIGMANLGVLSALATQQTPPDYPDFIVITQVDGKVIEPHSQVRLLPGPHTLRIEAEGVIGRDLDYSKSTADATFEVQADVTYRIDAVRSKHQYPWSYTIRAGTRGPEVVSTEPTFETVDLLAPPASVGHWPILHWNDAATGSFSSRAPRGQTQENWTRLFQRDRREIAPNMPEAEIHALLRGESRSSNMALTAEQLGPEAWLNRWEMQADERNPWERGVTLSMRQNGQLYSLSFVSRDPSAPETDYEFWAKELQTAFSKVQVSTE